jgi:hypothetical protein
VNPDLPADREAAQSVGVQVAEQQHGLEEHEARGPHGRGAAGQREEVFAGHRLDGEQQGGRREQGGGE